MIGVSFSQRTPKTAAKYQPNYKLLVDKQTSGRHNLFQPASRAIDVVELGGSQNAYSSLYGGLHQVMYNSDINSVVFVHRSASGIGSGSSGELSFDYSTDGGATWVNENWISPGMATAANVVGLRHPGITIFNPEGNTNPANARVVAVGPALTTVTSNSWGYSYEIDASVTNSASSVNEWYGSNTGTNQDFSPSSLEIGPDGRAWYISTDIDMTDPGNLVIKGSIYINRGTWNGSKFVWESPLKTLLLNYMTPADKILMGWSIAVDPSDGNHVYAVVTTVLVGDTREAPSPHVWETTDGGQTWTLKSAINYDQADIFEVLDPYIYYVEGEPMKPFVVNEDATVDSEGNLHIMCEVVSGAADWGYTWGFGGDGATSYEIYADYILSGNTWSVEYINDIECEAFTWGDVATYAHPQISRNESGSHIFYTWGETFMDVDSLNRAPSIMLRGWSVDEGMMPVDSINLIPEDLGILCFFHQVSPVVIDHGVGVDGRFEIPIVIPAIDISAQTDVDPVDFYFYLKGFTVNEWEAAVSTVTYTKPEVVVFPNPTAEYVTVSKSDFVELYDILGNKLSTVSGGATYTKMDLSKYPAGTYILKVHTPEGISVKKIQKSK